MFAIPAFTVVEIQRVGDPRKKWKPHVTRRELRFEVKGQFNGGAFVFREGDWLVRVERAKVTG